MKSVLSRLLGRGRKPGENESNLLSGQKEVKYRGNTAEEYLRKRAHRIDWHEEQLVLGHFLTQVPDELTVLDVPFGTGRFLPLYLAKKFSVLGVDISEEMLQLAKAYNAQDFARFECLLGDATDLQLKDDCVDLVVSYRFLGYILTVKRAKSAIAELVRVSRSHLLIQLQYLRDGEPQGKSDKLGHQLTWAEQEEFLLGLDLEILDRIDTLGKDEYQNTVLLAKKSG